MKTTDYFPLYAPTGEAFVNRHDERRTLVRYMERNQHVWIMGPRRIGKTSLYSQAIEDYRQAHHKVVSHGVDFLTAFDLPSSEQLILDIIGEVIGELFSPTQKSFELIRKIFKAIKPEFVINSDGKTQVKIISAQKSTSKTISDSLLDIDNYAQKHKTKIVLVFDEFQQLSTIEKGKSLEAALRHAAERVKSSTYIFSGSNRHILASMFEDSEQPLYKMTYKMTLGHIDRQHYIAYLRKIGRKRWSSLVADEVLETIFRLTDCHPYYINYLCSELWESDIPPTDEIVHREWIHLVRSDRHRIRAVIEALSANQAIVLKAIAKRPVDKPSSSAFARRINLAVTSITQALSVLEAKDLVYRNADQYWCVLDPSLGYYLTEKLI